MRPVTRTANLFFFAGSTVGFGRLARPISAPAGFGLADGASGAVTELRALTNKDSDRRGTTERLLREAFLSGLTGDAAAYHRFLDTLSGVLRSYFRKRLLGLPQEVEDLVQDALLAVHLKRHTYDRSQALTPWLYAIAHYKLVDMHRRRSRVEAMSEPLDEEHQLQGQSGLEAEEARHDLALVLEQLPERQRLPIVHVKVEGLSVAQTAEITGMSESAVKVGVHRGLKALAARWRGRP
jgi:RNA polymerase sigma-70 factor, ECF subfamily